MQNNKLPVVQKRGLLWKIKKGIIIALASLGIAAPQANAMASEIDSNVKVESETDIDKDNEIDLTLQKFGLQSTENDFVKILSSQVNEAEIIKENEENKENENRKQANIERIKQIANDKGYTEKTLDLVLNTYEDIEKNYDKNNLILKSNVTKEEYIEEYLDKLENEIGSLAFTQMHYNEEERSEEEKILNSSNAIGICFGKGEKIIVGEDPFGRENKDSCVLIHEMQHVDDDIKGIDFYGKLIIALNEGSSVYEESKVSNYLANSQRADHYTSEFNIYAKLVYLIGAEKLNDIIEGKSENDFNYEIINSIDQKYGGGKGNEIFNQLVSVSDCLCLANYGFKRISKENLEENISSIKESMKEYKEKYEIITDKNYELDITDKLYQAPDDILKSISFMEKSLEYYNNLYLSVDKSSEDIVKELENSVLECIKMDVTNISNKEEAKEMIQKWDVYRESALTSQGNMRSYEVDCESDYEGTEVSNIQEILYNKCIENDVLNIEDKKVFDLMIQSNLYDITNANVCIKNNDFYCISDGYILTKFSGICVDTIEDNDEIHSYKYVPIVNDANKIEYSAKSAQKTKEKIESYDNYGR